MYVFLPSFPLKNFALRANFLKKTFKFGCIVVDYLPRRKFPVIGQIAKWGLRTATVATLVGIYQFNTNDIGVFKKAFLFSKHKLMNYLS